MSVSSRLSNCFCSSAGRSCLMQFGQGGGRSVNPDCFPARSGKRTIEVDCPKSSLIVDERLHLTSGTRPVFGVIAVQATR